jgi:2-keto-4-pentenoate hydratase/2-oxohepta-3-ene-1,7-dioic acid hydratase in catechol pathway
MRWATIVCPERGVDRAALVEGDDVLALAPGPALVDLLGDLEAAADAAHQRDADRFALADVQLRAPIPHPPAVRDFYAFEQHVRTARGARGLEMDPGWYEEPVFYFSNPHGVIGPGDDVAAPPGSAALDYELELAAVVGRAGIDLDAATADAHIAGYCVMNDWSARDLQAREMRQGLGPAKGKDFATTLGPWLVTADELGDDLLMTASVNGREWSRGMSGSIHWSFPELLVHASRGARVEAGDVLGSGTVSTGCILELSLVHGQEAYPWLVPGDEVTLTIEGIGSITNRVVTGPASRS